MAKILIYHARDVQGAAQDLKSVLLMLGIPTTTLYNFRKLQKTILNERALYDLALSSHETIFCFASAGLFANCQLSSALRSILEPPIFDLEVPRPKLISAEQPEAGVIFPTWFLKAFPSHDHDFEEVVPKII